MIQTAKPHAVLSNLEKMATYYVKVNAFNSAGDGPMSDAFPVIVNPGGMCGIYFRYFEVRSMTNFQ